MTVSSTIRLAFGLAGLLLAPGAALAETSPRLAIVSTVSGEATVVRAGTKASAPLAFKAEVFAGDAIATTQGAIVRLLVGDAALITVREQSFVLMRSDAGSPVVEVQKGGVGVSIGAQRMAGRVFSVVTSNARAQVQAGTVIVTAERASTTRTTVYLLAGSTEVSGRTGKARKVTVSEPAALTVNGAVFGPVKPLSSAEAAQLIAQLRPGTLNASPDSAELVKKIATRDRKTAFKELKRLQSQGQLPTGENAVAHIERLESGITTGTPSSNDLAAGGGATGAVSASAPNLTPVGTMPVKIPGGGPGSPGGGPTGVSTGQGGGASSGTGGAVATGTNPGAVISGTLGNVKPGPNPGPPIKEGTAALRTNVDSRVLQSQSPSATTAPGALKNVQTAPNVGTLSTAPNAGTLNKAKQ